MTRQRINVAIIGLGFGAEFIPIYQKHPRANMYGICQRNAERLSRVGDAFGVEKRYANYDDVLADPAVDFVHVNSPIPDHAWMSIAALGPASTSSAPCPWPRRSTSAARSWSWCGRPA